MDRTWASAAAANSFSTTAARPTWFHTLPTLLPSIDQAMSRMRADSVRMSAADPREISSSRNRPRSCTFPSGTR
jgi:hypothetical protein